MTVVEPTLEGEGGHGRWGGTKLLANGTAVVIGVTMACPATRHMTRMHSVRTVPGVVGGYAQAFKRRKHGKRFLAFAIETSGRVHRDTLQIVHGKLVHAPMGVHNAQTCLPSGERTKFAGRRRHLDALGWQRSAGSTWPLCHPTVG